MTEPNPNVPPPQQPEGGSSVPPPQQPEGGSVPPPSTPPSTPPADYATPGTGGAYPAAYAGPEPTQDDRTMGMLAHLLGIVLGFIGPLIIWLIKKDQSPFANDQGKEALNFQITLLIGYAISAVTACLMIGMILAPIVWIVGLVFSIIGGLAANKGEAYRYPFNIRLVK